MGHVFSGSSHPIFKCELLVSGKVEHKKTKTFEDSVKNKKPVGGFNPYQKYQSNWIVSPNRGENKKYLKPAPRKRCVWGVLVETCVHSG